MPARSLVQMAQKACIRDIRNIEHVYDMPMKIDGADGAIKPVLWAIEQPSQLQIIEKNSPQIIGDDAEIWIKLIRRDVQKYADKVPPHPRNPKNWYKVYQELVKQNQREMDAQAAELEATLTSIRDAKIKNQLQSKDKSELPKLPKLGGMIYSQEGKIERQRAAAARAKKAEVNLGRAGSKTKNIFEKIRKEKREAALLRPLFRPNHTLNEKTTSVVNAPQSMVEDYRRPPPPRSSHLNPTTQPIAAVARSSQRRETPNETRTSGSTTEAREKRLLALTNPSLASHSSSSTPRNSDFQASKTSPLISSSSSAVLQDDSSVSDSTPRNRTSNSLRRPSSSEASQSPSPPTYVATSPGLTPPPATAVKLAYPKRPSPEARAGPPIMKRKVPADIFMPTKRRRVF